MFEEGTGNQIQEAPHVMKAVLLDWDGVLVDSTFMYFDLYRQICKIYNKHLPISTVEEFRDWYNPRWEQNYFDMGFKPEDIPEIVKYTSKVTTYDNIQFFPGIVSMLEELAAEYPIAIVSTTPKQNILDRLKKEGVDHFITAITGAEDGKSEKIEKIRNVLAYLKCDTGVMVGDTPLDIDSGKANSLKTVGASYGWISRPRMVKAAPTYLVDVSVDLCSAIKKALA